MTNRAKIDASKAKNAAKDYLDKREKRIERQKEEAIQKEMTKWLFPAKTREKAIERLKNDREMFSTWDWIESKGGHWASLAKEVILLCENSKEAHVYLDGETVEFLFGE